MQATQDRTELMSQDMAVVKPGMRVQLSELPDGTGNQTDGTVVLVDDDFCVIRPDGYYRGGKLAAATWDRVRLCDVLPQEVTCEHNVVSYAAVLMGAEHDRTQRELGIPHDHALAAAGDHAEGKLLAIIADPTPAADAEAAEAASQVSTMVDSGPTNERQARPLTKLPPKQQGSDDAEDGGCYVATRPGMICQAMYEGSGEPAVVVRVLPEGCVVRGTGGQHDDELWFATHHNVLLEGRAEGGEDAAA